MVSFWCHSQQSYSCKKYHTINYVNLFLTWKRPPHEPLPMGVTPALPQTKALLRQHFNGSAMGSQNWVAIFYGFPVLNFFDYIGESLSTAMDANREENTIDAKQMCQRPLAEATSSELGACIYKVSSTERNRSCLGEIFYHQSVGSKEMLQVGEIDSVLFGLDVLVDDQPVALGPLWSLEKVKSAR